MCNFPNWRDWPPADWSILPRSGVQSLYTTGTTRDRAFAFIFTCCFLGSPSRLAGTDWTTEVCCEVLSEHTILHNASWVGAKYKEAIKWKWLGSSQWESVRESGRRSLLKFKELRRALQLVFCRLTVVDRLKPLIVCSIRRHAQYCTSRSQGNN